jgi:nitrite reductase/ring-hydroxylating ferredoxin subunit/DMSO/TMAO reductase YedYZ heme-binding membrane subunit
MSISYQPILWNRQKKIYDSLLATGLILYIGIFAGPGSIIHPNATAETLLIRALGTAAFLLLHVALAIGPLARLNPGLLPLLYNRRHFGVATFLLGLAHGTFSLVQFHSFGDVSPLTSLLASNTRFGSVSQFPFQVLGFLALIILFLMAATSHDFWLHTLTPRVWKSLHMLVYAAYGLLIAHVSLGALQSETGALPIAVLLAGPSILAVLHITAATRESKVDAQVLTLQPDGFIDVCAVEQIPEKRAFVAALNGERVAVFKYDGMVSAISNVCRHQNGPLGEGRIIDGCVTCPWHGYQYKPECGASPPPFNDKVETFNVRVREGRVFVHPRANVPGTPVEPARI